MKPKELDLLIHECLEGCLSEQDAATLSDLLENSADARDRYWEMASMHGLLEHSMQKASLGVITGRGAQQSDWTSRWPGWSPLTAATAGVVFGILGASMVWAYALPTVKRTFERTVAIVSESFEDADWRPTRSFPIQANQWCGDLSAPINAVAGVNPAEGDRMVRLTSQNQQKFGYARHIVDVADLPTPAVGETWKLNVAAQFNSLESTHSHLYQVRLAAFSQEPAAIRDIWNDESVLFDTVLHHVSRNMHAQPGEVGWQSVRATMEIPAGTRCVVISLGASDRNSANSQAEHYLDDVQASLVISQSPAD